MKHLQLAIFDMDGLLFDTERIHFRAFQRTAKKLGFDFTFDTYLKVVGVTDEKGKEILKEIYGENSAILNAFDLYQGEVERIIQEEGIPVKPGVDRLLDTLDEKHIKKCIASSSRPEVIERNIKLTGLFDRFDFYISGTEVKHGKPSPDIFLEALNRANVQPEHALVLEDSYHGLQAAVNAGIRCIIIPDLIEPNDEMKDKAYRIFDHLGQVAELLKN
ncbi:HAD family hydrolase [Fervidibacillus halotolerans]|uniref:HAD family phosphatase n=1 Tax=Fervidibacillus halotolerans TaxID=2980027 RepID=A0A9E8RY19_9BACI|nr:HAD family phosphatase [Fervidibacillus halotolerans]WAA13350.1 HAD family phosphatase [Fervidibacillus halotolerans]